MGIDFPPNSVHPAAPVNGDTWPNPPVVGQPVYTWDGEKWTSGNLANAIGNVRYDLAQSLTSPQQTQAQTNIGAAPSNIVTTSPVVRYDAAQGLTAPQQVQARQNVYAAPFDALAYNGMQINGAMDVSQSLAVMTPVACALNGAITYIVDGWKSKINSGATATVSGFQYTSNLTMGAFQNSLLLQCVTGGFTTLAALDYITLIHPIEGYRVARLGWGTANAQPITIGFWLLTYVSGSFNVTIQNNAANRCYATTLLSATANVWQYYTVTIPGDTTGTWEKGNLAGMNIIFCFGAGSSYTMAPGSVGVWNGSNQVGVPGVSNFFVVNPNYIQITGVTVLPGNEAPSAARSALIMRPYGQELLLSMRHLQKLGPLDREFNVAVGQSYVDSFPIQPMRSSPTITAAITATGAFTSAQFLVDSVSLLRLIGIGGGTGSARMQMPLPATVDARL